MCVLILVAFLGSMVVMTGCFGGSSGGILAAVAFVIAISATGGSGAAVFAANLKGATNLSNHEITMIVQPLTSAGENTGSAHTISKAEISAVGDKFVAKKQIDIADGFNQYRIEVKAGEVTLVKAVKHLKDSQKTGEVPAEVSTTSTARTMAYEKWATLKNKSYETFQHNLELDNASLASITVLAGSIDAALNANPTNPIYNSASITNQIASIANTVTANEVTYKVSGYITAADMTSGQSDAWVYVYSDEAMQIMVNHVTTTNGNFSVDLSNGTYYFKPMKELHTYTPASTKVVVSGTDVTGINFQAARVQ